jgi:hypothetical protein
MKSIKMCAVLSALQLSSMAFAGSMGPSPVTSGVFAGLGGSYNSIKVDQYLNPLIGLTNVYDGNTLLATGTAGGPAIPYHETNTTFAPEAQLGYFRYFKQFSKYFGGVKFQYQYLDMTLSNNDIVAPQSGTFTTTAAAAGSTFTGRATIASSQVKVSDEIGLLAFLGSDYKQGHTYIGAGPVVFKTKNNLYNVTGYADLDGIPGNVTGTPTNFSSSTWVWGGIAQIGMTYTFKPTWFLDINYNYAITGKDATSYVKSFTNVSGEGYTNRGTLNGTASNRVIAQGIIVSINKSFPI